MNTMNTILAIADRQGGAEPALQRAVEIASRRGASIRWIGFVHADSLDDSLVNPAAMHTIQTALIEQKTAQLQGVLDSMDTRGVSIRLEVVWEKHIAAWVTETCKQTSVDLVIKTGHRSESWRYTPTDWQLLRECPAPVMIVASNQWRKQGRLLAALNLNARSRPERALNDKILEYAGKLARALGNELHCIFCIEVPTIAADLDLIDRAWYTDRISKNMQPRIKQLSARFEIPSENFHLEAGQPARVIPSVANRLKADLVILGTVGRRGLRGKLLGNTAENVLSTLRTDILAIKP